MQQRRVRLGDVLDDYCPRERRITNHVVVAMIEDEVKQTRCTTCEADHEFKHAKVPATRRKKTAEADSSGRPVAAPVAETLAAEAEAPQTFSPPPEDGLPPVASSDEAGAAPAADEDWPVHRRLIRATLPRPEGQVPERKAPEFTMHQAGNHPESRRGGHRRGKGQSRQAKGQSGQQWSGNTHFGQGSRYGGFQGNRRQGNAQGQPGQHSGQRPNRRGPKRGR